MKKSIILSILVMMLAVCARPCYSQQESQEVQKQNVIGTVVSTDPVASKIVLSSPDGDIILYVSDNTLINRGEDTITLDDIDIGDSLTIEYYNNSSGELEAINILDSNMGNDF